MKTSDGADRDGGVRHVERPEMPATPVDVHEVDDVARRSRSIRLPMAPPRISDRPSAGEPLVAAGCAARSRRCPRAPSARARSSATTLREVDAVQQTERDARVAHVHEIHEPGMTAAVEQRDRRRGRGPSSVGRPRRGPRSPPRTRGPARRRPSWSRRCRDVRGRLRCGAFRRGQAGCATSRPSGSAGVSTGRSNCRRASQADAVRGAGLAKAGTSASNAGTCRRTRA